MACIIIFSVIGIFIVFVVFYIQWEKAKLIERFDTVGLTTKAGKYYAWSDLLSIRYSMTVSKYTYEDKKIHSLHFYFRKGRASVNYLMHSIGHLIEIANGLQVPKTEKTVGYYKR